MQRATVTIQCNPDSIVLIRIADVLTNKQLADAPAVDRSRCCAVQTQHRPLGSPV